MTSEELFIAIQNKGMKTPSELPSEVVDFMVRCANEGWEVEFIDDSRKSFRWETCDGYFLGDIEAFKDFISRELKHQSISCFRIVIPEQP